MKMRKSIWILLALCTVLPLLSNKVSATDASGEAEVGYEVNEDSLYELQVQVIGYGSVRDGTQRIRTNVTYEVTPGEKKTFVLEPDEGYLLKQVRYEKPETAYAKDITAQLKTDTVVIPTECTEMKLIVVYEQAPVPRKGFLGYINTGDGNDPVPYLILMLAALLVLAQRRRKEAGTV